MLTDWRIGRTFTPEQKEYEMRLKHDEMAWMPQDQENYLTVLRKGSVQPLSRDQFLNLQVAMLSRLVQDFDCRPFLCRVGKVMNLRS